MLLKNRIWYMLENSEDVFPKKLMDSLPKLTSAPLYCHLKISGLATYTDFYIVGGCWVDKYNNHLSCKYSNVKRARKLGAVDYLLNVIIDDGIWYQQTLPITYFYSHTPDSVWSAGNKIWATKKDDFSLGLIVGQKVIKRA
jgi:hypothetical protein